MKQFTLSKLTINITIKSQYNYVDANAYPKGQICSKCLIDFSLSPKKRTKQFVFTTSRLVFVRFLGESESTKKSF